jgi:Putative adhesin
VIIVVIESNLEHTMTLEKWIIHPGETRVIDIETVRKLKVGLVGGQIDVIGHDEPGARIEVHGVTIKDLRIEVTGDVVEIDHPQLKWDNFLEVFRNFGAGGPKAEISVAVPREVALTLGVVSASALVSGIRNDARLNTVSGDIIVGGIRGDLTVNAVSGDVQIRELVGALSANSVSGDVAATGSLRKATIDTVSGAMLVDTSGDANQVSLNTVSGNATVRLDDGHPANYAVRSVSGRVQIDGVVRSGKGRGPTTNFTGSAGELSGSFADVRANSVSGDVTVLRRAASSDAGTGSSDAAADAEAEW